MDSDVGDFKLNYKIYVLDELFACAQYTVSVTTRQNNHVRTKIVIHLAWLSIVQLKTKFLWIPSIYFDRNFRVQSIAAS